MKLYTFNNNVTKPSNFAKTEKKINKVKHILWKTYGKSNTDVSQTFVIIYVHAFIVNYKKHEKCI